jgi:hypothetical protein
MLQLEQTSRAEQVVRERIAVKPTPEMLCYLADLSGEASHLHEAWELSGEGWSDV